MESWSYISEESVSATGAIARAKNGSLNWELKTPFSSGTNLVCPSQPGIDNNQGFAGFGFPQMMRKSFSNDCNSASMVRDGIMFNPITTAKNAFSEEEDSSSKLSTSVVESNSRDSGLIDLKLGRFGGDQRDVHPNPKPNPNLGSAESSAKRLRVGGFGSQTPLCQVHGCKKNLSSSKDYHKRHKVCEAHSKTSKVIVNSLEQRFCQQCSRFHLLAEFDEDKRSCRKRLAGHNERRRKPYVGVNSRPGRLFPLYKCTTEGTTGSRSKGTMTAPLSYTSQDITPNSIPYPQKYGTNEGGGRIKLEDGTCHDPRSTISFTNGKLRSQCLYPFDSEKYYPLHESATNSRIRSESDGGRTQYSHNTGLLNFGSRSVFLRNPIGGEEDFTMFGSASTVQGLSGIPSDPERALSLLSSQSQTSSSLSSQFHMAQPLLIPCNQDARFSGTQLSENLLEMGPQASGTGVSNNCHSSGISSVEETHLDPILISDDSNAATFGIDGLFRGSEYRNSKDQLCSAGGSTIDLLQLSSQLQRVEHQRQGLRVKPEDDAFFGLRIS